jgi:hypothetical protein
MAIPSWVPQRVIDKIEREKAVSDEARRLSKREKAREAERRYRATHTAEKREKARKYRDANPDKERERHRKYREANREKRMAYARSHYAANRSKYIQRASEYFAANFDKYAEVRRKYKAANPDKVNALARVHSRKAKEKLADHCIKGFIRTSCGVTAAQLPWIPQELIELKRAIIQAKRDMKGASK